MMLLVMVDHKKAQHQKTQKDAANAFQHDGRIEQNGDKCTQEKHPSDDQIHPAASGLVVRVGLRGQD